MVSVFGKYIDLALINENNINTELFEKVVELVKKRQSPEEVSKFFKMHDLMELIMVRFYMQNFDRWTNEMSDINYFLYQFASPLRTFQLYQELGL